MSISRIADRYAKSLLEFALEQNKLDEVVQDVEVLTKSLESRDLYLLIKSPIIAASKKRSIFERLFGDKLSQTAQTFCDIIIRKGRENILPEMLAAFKVLHKAHQRISTVTLTTSDPLDEGVKEQIITKLKASSQTLANVELVTAVDPDLIGGFTLEFDDRLYDSSVAAKLNELRKQFAQNNYEKTF